MQDPVPDPSMDPEQYEKSDSDHQKNYFGSATLGKSLVLHSSFHQDMGD